MLELTDHDLAPSTDFPLRWRFTVGHGGAAAAAALERLRPLAPAAAARLESATLDRRGEGGHFTISFRSDDAPDLVRERLRGLPPAPEESVLVSWDARTAALTDWETFTAHWDDFCYSSSDDVSVVPLAGAWVLCYRRYDVFQFGDGAAPT